MSLDELNDAGGAAESPAARIAGPLAHHRQVNNSYDVTDRTAIAQIPWLCSTFPCTVTPGSPKSL